MRRELLRLLVDPLDRTPLTLEARAESDSEVEEGILRGAGGRSYPVTAGIPRLVAGDDAGQAQTRASFAFKWRRSESYGSEGMRRQLHGWLLERYGFGSPGQMRSFFAGRRCILDAGCGAGFATSAWIADGWNASGAEWVGADISDAIEVARARLGGFGGTSFVQADVIRLPFRPETFDTIFAEGVLHHTPSTEEAFKALVPLLTGGGELMIYVYRRKAPVREFADDYVRDLLAGLDPDQAWEALRPLTRLGRALSELEAQVEVEEDVPLLGIRAGRYDVQRLVYWHLVKLFWNPDLTFEENVHLNFDWYAPRYAHRHTEEEVRGWFDSTGLEIVRFDVHDAGFTVRSRKP